MGCFAHQCAFMPWGGKGQCGGGGMCQRVLVGVMLQARSRGQLSIAGGRNWCEERWMVVDWRRIVCGVTIQGRCW
jgi:hypothetical protein